MNNRMTVQVVDFFSGCGGTSYGFHTASHPRIRFEIRGAVDIDYHANATYQRMLGVVPLAANVTTLTDEKQLAIARNGWGIDETQPLLLIGCSPCQGFSSHRKKDKRSDPRDSLIEAFGKIAVMLRPDVVVMENVPEMLHREHWDHFDAWRVLMTEAGYRVRVQVHNLAQFGVPQERYRALVIAARDWRYFSTPRPLLAPNNFKTVRDAIGSLPPLGVGNTDPNDPMHVTSKHRTSTVDLIRLIPPNGGSRRSLPDDVGPNCHKNVDGFRDVYGRLFWDRPAVAITARCRTPSCGRFVHPEQHRGLSVREAALLQGFPREYVFEGPFDDKFKQIGNAVSPIFARAVANHLADEWLADHTDQTREIDGGHDVNSPIQKSFSSSIASLKRELRRASSTNDSASQAQVLS